MIMVTGLIESTSEDIASLRDAVLRLEVLTRKEPGCIDYCFSVELGDSSRLRITERWESLEALRAHFSQPHLADFQRAIAERRPGNTDICFYQVEEIDMGHG